MQALYVSRSYMPGRTFFGSSLAGCQLPVGDGYHSCHNLSVSHRDTLTLEIDNVLHETQVR